MTKKQKPRRYSFAADLDVREDDFILADLAVLPDEKEPSPVPLNHFLDDEETIDRLLINSGFEVNHELEQVDVKPDPLGIGDISRADEFGVNFEVQNAMAGVAGIFDSEERGVVLDKDAGNDFLVTEENPETAKQVHTSETIYPGKPLESFKNDAGIAPLSSVRSEQEALKKQINDYENKVKKAAIITYTSLSFGIVALLSTVVMGVIVSGMQSKVSKLTELVSIIEEDMSSIIEKNSDMEINNTDSSIEQLNQIITVLPEQFAEKSQLTSGLLAREKRSAVTKQATENKSLDDPQTSANVLKKEKLSQTIIKTSAKKKTNNAAQATGDWSVNLTAYKDLSYAKSKAAKFIQKGIPVKVIAVNMNNTTWYRLRVGGFKNKEKATSYAAKIKKSLNLNTISVGNS